MAEDNSVDNNKKINSEDVLLTFDDIFQIDKEAQKNAEALLGGQDDMVCTYPEGYKYRQPLYSCRTCASNGQKAGVCYACSLNCHDGHDLVELYTKRKFCCDCGNSKFKDKCKLFEKKTPENTSNSYNHNFDQLYCTCMKPFPPAEEADEEELEDMHQCVVCEDWFHLSHLYTETEEKEALEQLLKNDMENVCDFVCKQCVGKLPFLMSYRDFAFRTSSTAEGKITDASLDESVQATSGCKLEKFKHATDEKPQNIYFNGVAWRNELCRCSGCMNLYEDLNCAFLLDHEDTMEYYDEKRRENMALKGETSLKMDEDANLADEVYNVVVKMTNNRDAALNAYIAVDDMSKHVADYFKKLEHGKVITKEDVEKCFDELKAKRPRLDLPEAKTDCAWTQ